MINGSSEISKGQLLMRNKKGNAKRNFELEHQMARHPENNLTLPVPKLILHLSVVPLSAQALTVYPVRDTLIRDLFLSTFNCCNFTSPTISSVES